MKQVVSLLFLSAAAIWLLAADAQAAVTFTLTPSAVSNTYSGNITLDIAGLDSGETVVVQKFIDANTNGVIEATDWLAQQFQLTDGQASAIGGVINSNIPGDLNSAAGTIKAQLNLLSSGIEQHFVGSYAFKLSSPTGRFGAITNVLTITNSAFAQSFAGNVVCSGTNVPNVAVLMFPGAAGESSPKAGGIANNSGSYTLTAIPGTYSLAALKPDFVTDFTACPTLTLNAGATLSTNLSLLPATRSISGGFVDAANPGTGLAGFMVICESADGRLALGFTDTNGNFSAAVTSGQWKVSLDGDGLPALGYLRLQNELRVDTSTGSVAGLIVAFTKGTALIYGSFKDDQNRPLAGIKFYAGDYANQYEAEGITDSNGNYALAVVAGSWRLSFDNTDPLLANYLISQGADVTLADGQAVQQNFKAVLGTNHISGYLKDNGNNPVANVGIYADATINGTHYNQYVQTDATGFYSLSVANGSWNVGVSCGEWDDSVNSHGYQCVGEQSVTIANNNPVINFTVQPCGPLQVTTSSPLSDGQVGAYYNVLIQASGCYQPFNWSLAPGSQPLPAGLNLSPDGTLAGDPNASGTFTFSVRVTDSTASWADRTLSLTINPPLPPLQITTTSLPNGTQNAFYSQSLTASGGQTPYNWWLPGGSVTLPPGTMSLTGSGVLSGTPTAPGTYNFWVGVYDSASPQNAVTQMLSLTINSPLPPLQITTTTLPNGTQNTFYSQQLGGSGGQTPYNWSLAPGSADVPPGLSLGSNGLLSGTPSSSGTWYFYARVTDAATATADHFLSLTINGPPLQVTNVSLPNATVGGSYSAQLGALGGQPPYNWSLALGSANLPPGVSLSPSGLLSGTPATNGLFNFIVKVTDASFASVTRLLGIQINPRPTLVSPGWFSAGQLQFQVNGAAGQNYTILVSTNLVNWSWVGVTNAPSDSFVIRVDRSTNRSAFYRLLVSP